MPPRRYILRFVVITSALSGTGCEDPASVLPPGEQTSTQPVSEQADSIHTDSGGAAEQNPTDATAENPEIHKPLDLSMPAQPEVDPGSFEGKIPSDRHLLPDLFEQPGPSHENPYRLKGRVLMDQTGKENFDAVEGGQIILEMKTR